MTTKKPSAKDKATSGDVARSTPDTLEEAFAWYCPLQGFDIKKFDAWLGTLTTCGAKTELQQRRALAIAAMRANEEQTVLRHLEWMLLRWHEIKRSETVIPLARQGKAYGELQAQRRRDKPAISNYDRDDGRNARIRAFHARLVASGEADPTQRTAAEFGLTGRSIRRIVNR